MFLTARAQHNITTKTHAKQHPSEANMLRLSIATCMSGQAAAAPTTTSNNKQQNCKAGENRNASQLVGSTLCRGGRHMQGMQKMVNQGIMASITGRPHHWGPPG